MTNSTTVVQRQQKFHRRRRRKFKRLFWILLGGLILVGALGLTIYLLTKPKPPSGFSVPYNSGVQFN
jgi:cell division septal protein FtsQ